MPRQRASKGLCEIEKLDLNILTAIQFLVRRRKDAAVGARQVMTQIRLLTLSVELADDCVDERVLRCDVSSTDRHYGRPFVGHSPDRPDEGDRRLPNAVTLVNSAPVCVASPSLNTRRFHHTSTPGVQSNAANGSSNERGASAAASSATAAAAAAAAAEAIERRQSTAALRHSTAEDTRCAVYSQRAD